MGRPKSKIDLSSPEVSNSAKALKKVLKNHDLTQKELAEMLSVDKTRFSKWITCKARLPEDRADQIVELFPKKKYLKSWLLGYETRYSTAGEKFSAEWEEFKKLTDETTETQNKIKKAVASLMELYGITWKGETSKVAYFSHDDIRKKIEKPASTFDGVDFYTWELATIAEKIYDQVGAELRYLARVKREAEYKGSETEPVELHIGGKHEN